MTREQIIVLGVIAAAFVAGWAVHALTGRRGPLPAGEAVTPPHADEHLDRVVERARRELDRAVRAYVASALLSDGPRAPRDEPTADPVVGDVSAALRDDAANASMLSGMFERDGERDLSDRELDLADWGFAYGVAWARARARDPDRDEDVIARTALRAAEPVFRAYAGEGGWTGSRNGRT